MLFTVLSILPLLLVHEAPGLRFVGNKPFFLLSSVSPAFVTKVLPIRSSRRPLLA